jgi:glyoxylase-like metal-dependent hydrolase (beta-lactamase superfamily II)
MVGGLLIGALLLLGCSPGGTDDPELWEGAEWVDDWFVVESIDDATFAIGEPLYYQRNVSYLIVGEDRAILFDSGPGERDISPVVEALTSLPVTAAFSHAHFDHIGNHDRFESVALVDVPSLRERVQDGIFQPTFAQYADFGRPEFAVTEWWAPGGIIELGGRRLEVILSPGHTPESIVLHDHERKQLFTGDFIYPGELFAFNPGADLRAYMETTRRLLVRTRVDDTLLGAHESPRLPRYALVQLERILRSILDGKADWERAWYLVLPLRRYADEDVSILTLPWGDPTLRD